MKEGWEVKPLGEVCSIQNGGTPKSKVADYWADEVPWLTPKDMGQQIQPEIGDTPRKISKLGLSKCSAKLVPAGSVIMSTRAPIGHLSINTVPMAFNQGCRGLTPSSQVDLKYLYYYLVSSVFELQQLGTGTTFKELSAGALKSFGIPIPPLDEQKWIVAVLDAAFEGLTRAKESAEANLQNARELFGSAQEELLTDVESDWVQVPVSQCFKLKSGDGLTAKAMIHGEFEVYGGNGVAGLHNKSNLTGLNVIIGRVGALCGNARLIANDIWLTDNAFLVRDYKHDFDLTFLTYLLNFKDLRSFARQTAQPVISNSSLKNVILSFPSEVQKQNEIAEKLIALEAKVVELEAEYTTKLTDIADLRQSLLQKAFAGELT